MNDDMKWPAIFGATCVLAIAIVAIATSYKEAEITKIAMENGYSQKIEGLNIIWVKANNAEKD